MSSDKALELARKIWDAINEADYDPMHPQFEHFDDKVKDEVIAFSSRALAGFPVEPDGGTPEGGDSEEERNA